MTNHHISKCSDYSKGLENMGSRFSLIYTSSILISVLLSLILLPEWITNRNTQIIIGISALILAILPLVLKEKIEKVHGYYSLSKEFENLENSFRRKGNIKENLSKLEELTKKTSDYPLDKYAKWKAKK